MHHAAIVIAGKLARRPRHPAMNDHRIEWIVGRERTRQHEAEFGQASIGRRCCVHPATIVGERPADFRRCWSRGCL